MDNDERAASPPRDNLMRASYPAVELRAEDEGGMPTMVGYFARFNEWTRISSQLEGTFLERVTPGAFARTLKNNRSAIRVLFQHGHDPQIGDKPLGPIADVREDGDGAYYEVPLLDTQYNRELLPGLRAGLYGASFRFNVLQEDFDSRPKRSTHNPDGIPERTIREARVLEFGPVTFPAYAGASAGVRSLTFADLDAAVSTREVTALPDAEPEAVVPHLDGGTRESPPPRVAPTPKDPPAGGSSASRSADPVEYTTREDKAARVTELKADLARRAVEFPGVMPDDAQAIWDDENVELDNLVRDIAAWDARQARVVDLEARGSAEHVDAPKVVPNIIRSRSDGDIFDTATIERAGSPEKRDQLYRDNAMRAVETARAPMGDAWRNRMASLLDEADTPGKDLARLTLATASPQYRRAFNEYVRSGGQERGTALAVGVDGTGGYSVPVTLDPTVIPIGAHSFNPFRQVCRTVQIVGTDTWRALTSTAVTAAYTTEALAATEQGPTFAQPEFIVKRAVAFVTASYEMMQDRSDLAAELGTLFSEAKDNIEENKMAVGAAASTNPVGMFVDGQYTAVTTAANPFAVGDLAITEAALPIRYRANGMWFLSRTGIRTIAGWETAYGTLFNSQLGYPNAGGLQRESTGQTGMRLMGYPVVEVPSGTFSTTTAGTISGVLVDPSRYVIVDRVGMSIRVIPDMLDGATPSFPTGQSGIYAFWRNTGGALNVDAGRQIKVHA